MRPVPTQPRRQRSRWPWAIVPGLLAGGLLLVAWPRTSEPIPTDSAALPVGPEIEIASVAVSTPPPLPAQVTTAQATGDAPTKPDAATHPAIDRLLELSRYASTTRRLDEHASDLLNPNMRHERRGPLPGDDAQGWEVRFTADRYALRGDESAVLQFELWQNGDPVVPLWLEIVAAPLGDSAASRSLPIQQNAARHIAHLQPQNDWPSLLGTLRVTARFEAPGLAEKSGSLSFYFTSTEHLPANLTGEFDDWLLNGDLAIGVGIEVFTAGTYRLEGNLYDTNGTPVAWARFQDDLSAGKQEVNLVFDGLVFRDRDIRPPYVLRKLRGYRLRPGDAPHREDIASHPGEYRLQDRYVLDDFRREPSTTAGSLELIARYEDALARGVKLTTPRK